MMDEPGAWLTIPGDRSIRRLDVIKAKFRLFKNISLDAGRATDIPI
jgi:hypothetical protein